jgi:flagellar biosynthetic protein FlhB
MAEDGDKESKTEEPTGKRLADARNKGQVATSREVSTALLLLAAVGLFYFQGQALWDALKVKMRFFLSVPIQDDLTAPAFQVIMRDVMLDTMLDLAPFFAFFLIVAVISSLLQHGWLFTLEPLRPKLSKINPLQGFKRLFSLRSVVELFKSILKMSVVGLAVYWGIKDSINQVVGLMNTSVEYIILFMASDAMGVLWRVALAFVVLAVLDFVYQHYEFMQGLRMTKQEVKDEMKQMEGDPQVKGRIRQLQREMAQRRMMDEVPRADVVITNPTQYAVALKYVSGQMNAPKVVAKGRGPIAARIREIAQEHGIPLVENPPLARTLYHDVELEHPIPPELFKAVAEILAYVFRIRGRRGPTR